MQVIDLGNEGKHGKETGKQDRDGKPALKNALLRQLPVGAAGTQSPCGETAGASGEHRPVTLPEGQDSQDVYMPGLTSQS